MVFCVSPVYLHVFTHIPFTRTSILHHIHWISCHCIGPHDIALHCVWLSWYTWTHAMIFFGVWRQCPRDQMQMSSSANKMVLILTTNVNDSFFGAPLTCPPCSRWRVQPFSSAWSSRRKDYVELASQHKIDHHCRDGRGCVTLGRENPKGHFWNEDHCVLGQHCVFACIISFTRTSISHDIHWTSCHCTGHHDIASVVMPFSFFF